MLTTDMILIFSLLFASAFFSSSETALTSVPKSYLLQKSQNVKSAKLLVKMLNNPNNLITSLLVGNNIANIFFTTLITSFFVKHFGDNHTLLLASFITFIILIFAEILPKTYAFNNSSRVALFFAPLVYLILIILKPITFIFIKINSFFLSFSKNRKQDHDSSLDNLRGAIEMLQRNKNSYFYSIEKQMLHGILDLNEICVGEIMNHRKNIFCVDINDSNEAIINSLLECNYSRIPVFQDNEENIIGILDVKEIFKQYKNHGYNFQMKDLVKKPYFIPDSTLVSSLLHKLKENKERMALVVDEYGSFMGILTIGDILTEVTGEIESIEHEHFLKKIRKENNNYIVDGDLTIRDLNRHNNWNLPDEEFTTVAGLILYETGKIPNIGNIFVFHGCKFTILEKVRHQIVKVKITPIENV